MNMNTTGIRIAVLAALALLLAGCSTTKFHPGAVRTRMTELCQQHKYQEARDLEVKAYPAGDPNAGRPSPEETVKEELIGSLVNPSETAWTAARIRALESQVDDALSRHDDEAARQAIYGYGITPTRQRAVDAVVYLAKNAYLNSRVNPATLSRWERFAAKYVDGSIQSGDYAKATAAAKRIGSAAAYPERIDDLLESSADRALDQSVAPEDAAALVAACTNTLYMLIAPRAGFRTNDYLAPAEASGPFGRGWKDLRADLEKLQHLAVPTSGFEDAAEPDWTTLKRVLADFRRVLVEDDVSEEDAKTISDALFAGFKALAPNGRNGLTTYELNDRLHALQATSQSRILEAIVAERARANAERRAQLDRHWAALAGQMAAAIDFSAREAAFTAGISDCVEPAVNRMLGEGARVLRLHRTRGTITPQQATSLLLAALYMGFDDVANLALAKGADIDGTSEKDIDGRTPYLLALQYGFKSSAEKLLAKADTSRRDANGAGAVHYAVRANDTTRLLALLGAGADARTPDRDGSTPLMLAARLRNPALATMLLAKSDIDATDSRGRAAVHFAAAAGDLRTLRALVAAGASVSGTTADGDDLLTLACAANAEDVITYLLDERKLPVAERPVSWCVIHAKVLALKTLVAHGGVLTDRHLAAAVKLALPDMVRYLVEQGCDVNASVVHKAAAALQNYSGTLDAPWTALPGDTTATIATPANSAAEEVLLYLYSQGCRPPTPNGR